MDTVIEERRLFLEHLLNNKDKTVRGIAQYGLDNGLELSDKQKAVVNQYITGKCIRCGVNPLTYDDLNSGKCDECLQFENHDD